jgi:hypothetical protein
MKKEMTTGNCLTSQEACFQPDVGRAYAERGVKKICLLMGIILLTSCDTRLRDLAMKKTPYLGYELRIDGYYYSNPLYNQYADVTNMRVAVFYKDGFCINTLVELPKNQDTLSYIENEILLNDAQIAKMKKDPFHIGVFQIMYPDIQFEIWEYRSWTFTHFGKIVNDTAFIINKQVYHYRNTNQTYTENLTYKFKQFSPKPDSTNVWIK